MKTIQSFIILLFVTIATQTVGQDVRMQTEKQAEMQAKREQRFMEVSKRLNLSETQQKQLREIVKQNRKEMKAVHQANASAGKEQHQKAIKEQFLKNDQRIQAILDAKQKVEYEKLKAEKKAELKRKKAERKALKEELESEGDLF
ncbi:MAG: hypothetical protein MUE96_11595 [Bacteroidia bacterium]|jgi:hypothetical protein|nr:hypothetical protein [Bacteroidia bacterium]